MRCLSLFAGIDGFGLGFRWAGIETVCQVEQNRSCLSLLEKNFPKASRFSDVRAFGRRRIGKFDVISGGSPCQNLSTLGDMEGIDGNKSWLFWEFVRIIESHRPTWFLLENVPQLLHAYGDRILAALEGAGYSCWPLILGARALGGTHERKRAWILGRRADAGCECRHPFGMAPGPEAREEMARAIRGWNSRVPLLVPRNGHPGDSLRPELADSYAGVVRDCHGIPLWLDRLGALGNAVVPQIPMLFGCFMQKWEGVSDE